MKEYRKPQPMKAKYRSILEQIENASASVDSNDDKENYATLEFIDADLNKNEAAVRSIFHKCSDLVYRRVSVRNFKLLVVYIDGLIDAKHLDESVLKPLMFEQISEDCAAADSLADLMSQRSFPVGETKVISKIDEAIKRISSGETVFFMDGDDEALSGSMKGWAKRAVTEPQSEQVIRGPREGFIETLRINTSLLRRKIRSPKLKMETYSIGEYTHTDIVITYIEGIASKRLIEEVKNRVQRIQIDGVLETGYIEGFVEDNSFSLFPTVQNTERPDVVAANLLEGKVAILADGTPFSLIVPMTFWNALNANEDYYERFFIATALRWIRYVFVFVALLLPSIYVSLISFQQEMIPTTLLLSVAAAQEATPFPAIVEAFGMEFMFEALREAGVRLPKPVGSAISIVGALVIGEAAVQAGIVSAPMVIVVATTGIASFTIPKYNVGSAIRLLRFPLLLLSGVLGFYGITIGLIAILIHIITLKSFGTPYFSPIAPLVPTNLRDVFLRAPWWGLNRRPSSANSTNMLRVPHGQQPSPRKDPRS